MIITLEIKGAFDLHQIVNIDTLRTEVKPVLNDINKCIISAIDGHFLGTIVLNMPPAEFKKKYQQ